MPFQFEDKDQEITFNNGAKSALDTLFKEDPQLAEYATTRAGVSGGVESQMAAGPEQPIDPLALGLVDEDYNATEKGLLAYNLREAGLLDDNLKLTEKGLAFSMTDQEIASDDANLPLFNIREEAGIGVDPDAETSFGTMVSGVLDFLWDAGTFVGLQVANEAKGLWDEGSKDKAAIGQLAIVDKTIEDAKNLGEIVKPALARTAAEMRSTPITFGGTAYMPPQAFSFAYSDEQKAAMFRDTEEKEKLAKDLYQKAKFQRFKNRVYLESVKDGELAEQYLGFEGAVTTMADLKDKVGTKEYAKIVKGAGAATDLLGFENAIPANLAVKLAKSVSLMSRATMFAQRRLGKLTTMARGLSQLDEGIGAATANATRLAPQLKTTENLIESLSKKLEQVPTADKAAVQANLDKAIALRDKLARQIDQNQSAFTRMTTSREALASDMARLEGLVSTQVAQKVARAAEVGAKIKKMPFNVTANIAESVGAKLTKLDEGLSSIAERFGIDKAYQLATSGLGQTGLYTSGAFLGPVGPAIGAAATVLKSGEVVKNLGKFSRAIGDEVVKARGQIPFWQRVANNTNISPAHKATAHLLDTATAGGAIPGAIRRTSRGVIGSYPVDLAFEYVYSEPGEDFTEVSKRALAESLVIGGSSAALGGMFMGSKARHRQLAVGDEINFSSDLSREQKAIYSRLPMDVRRSVGTYAAVNPGLNFKFTESGSSAYDSKTGTVLLNVNSTNPLKPLLAHEVLHHIVFQHQMEPAVAAMLVGDGQRGGILRDSDGNLDPEFQSFMDRYNKRMVDSGQERIGMDAAAVEFFIDQSADRIARMAESGELGRAAGKTQVRRALDTLIDTIVPKIPIISNLNMSLGGLVNQEGRPVKGNGLFSPTMQEMPQVRNMTNEMLSRSGGRAVGGFTTLGSDTADGGISLPIKKGDKALLDTFVSLFETEEVNGVTKPKYDSNGDPIMLNPATDAARAAVGLKIAEIYDGLGRERKQGELFMAEDGTWQGTYIGDDVIRELAKTGILNKEQMRMLKNINSATRNFTGDRFTVINHPATKKVGKKVRYATLKATVRDVVPVSLTISKDGNLLVGLMSVNQLQDNIVKRARTARGRKLYKGNTEAIRNDIGEVMKLHRQNQRTDDYFNQKYGITDGKEYKNFINTVFGLVGGKAQKDLNPLFDADKIDSRDQVYRTYRMDRISQATRMSGDTAVPMPFVYGAVKLNMFPNGEPNMMPDGTPIDETTTAPIDAEEQPATENRFMPEGLDEQGFYSNLEKVITSKIPNRATPQQIMATIDPTRGSGVKAEEIKWSGIEQALSKLEKDGKVSKEDLLNYLRDEGRVRFEEVTLGGRPVMRGPDLAAEFSQRMMDKYGERWIGMMTPEENAEYDAAIEAAPDVLPTKFSQYTLPGGENYREVVLAMPIQKEPEHLQKYWVKNNLNQRTGPWTLEEAEGRVEMFGGEIIRDIDRRNTPSSNYTSSHFPDIPNYVAHMRLNERTDASGKPGLFVEELQSDRHQAGREKGYQQPFEEWMAYYETPDGKEVAVGHGKTESEARASADQGWANLVTIKARKIGEGIEGAIPDAPFRKDWYVQLFKRALRDAVDSGKEWIGWTTGETQNDRFDLSKQVDKLVLFPDMTFRAYKDGAEIISQKTTAEALPDLIGKDAAKKLLDAPTVNESPNENQEVEPHRKLEGADLKVGGSGMKGFYDQILPKEIQKYVKQFNGKVEKSEIATSMRTEEVDPYDLSDATPEEISEMESTGMVQGPTTPIWKVNITPEMRGVKEKGQLRFMPEKLDTEYMKAVESGDVEAQQKMVDDAARKAGYTLGPVWHGTDADFNVFQKTMDFGFHFGTEEQARYKTQNRRLIRSFLDAQDLLRLPDNSWDDPETALNALAQSGIPASATSKTLKKEWDKLGEIRSQRDWMELPMEEGRKVSSERDRKWRDKAKQALRSFANDIKGAGYDGVVYANRVEGEGDSFIVFSPNQIKSADPVTRDDQGNVIPLSKRFNLKSSDIRFMPESESVPGGFIVPSDLDTGKDIARGKVSKLKEDDFVAGFRFLPENFDEDYQISQKDWKRLQGKSGFAFVSDWADSDRPYITRKGRKIDVMFGGIGYPFMPGMKGKAAWASTSGGSIIKRMLSHINETDGVGLVVLGGAESSASSRAFSMAFIEELEDSLADGRISKTDLDRLVRQASDKYDLSLSGYDNWVSKLGDLTFEDRANLVKMIGSHNNKKEFKILSWRDVLDKYNIQKNKGGKYAPGQIVAIVQFDKDKSGKGSAVSAAKAKVPVHPSYEVVVKGKAIGTVKGLKISDFFKDFFDAEGTEPKSYTRKVQTKMPRFKIGEGSSQIAKPTKNKAQTS